ncbi:glutamate synthase (NADPH/NADH) small chain [Rhizobiales bacterium GAS191]|nr:glutamate synthase (NADPH/NADH) small chain [Rhizobiales bacterium GAS113]SED69854.1 glutamate synthase (NADPH/NADH) small chain [Rhizobiales bacterium GAS191]SEE72714.1 glutamate synthase (NADPH/NADH) small chain [Rhizobiales bacterium GAS188]
MSAIDPADGIKPGRLPKEAYAKNFADLHPPLTTHEAFVEAERCYFCYEAPCQTACPTAIDIPMFIRQIAAGNDHGAAETIFSANILGGMCARVCPTETLCEEACVRQASEGKPVQIGLLQRHATDALMASGSMPFTRGAPTGKRIAVIGAGPAGLACAHKLSELGHDVVLFEAKDKLGGLNEYGIAAYKTVEDFAQKEVEFVLAIGGIEVRTGQVLGDNLDLAKLRQEFDGAFLGVGLAGVNKLRLAGEGALSGVRDAVDFIAALRQADDLATIAVGRRVVVIGGGMTAIDAAVQSKRLGAEDVTIVYRRGEAEMKASGFERELARTDGVLIRHFAAPKALEADAGRVTGIVFERMAPQDGKLAATGESYRLDADMVLTAIGQVLLPNALGGAASLHLEGGRIVVDEERRTSVSGLWAGGDCVAGGEDLTVSAVEDGKQAALSIDRTLAAAKAG